MYKKQIAALKFIALVLTTAILSFMAFSSTPDSFSYDFFHFTRIFFGILTGSMAYDTFKIIFTKDT